MIQTTKKILPWVMLSGLCYSSGLWAAQLGKLEVLSAGGEPFVAQVQIEAVQSEARPTLKARLAAPEAFRAARLELNPNLSALKFEVRDGGKPGTAVVRITADKPVPAGFMDALIELTWSGGRVAREYTFNVPKAPETSKPSNLPELAPSKPDSVASSAKPLETKPSDTKPSPSKPSAIPVERTHQVLKGETLSEIALQSVGQGVGLNQAMAAIFEANKNQFIEGSVHLLREGAVLQIPNRASIRQRTGKEALLILARQDDRNVYALQARQLGILEASAQVAKQMQLQGPGSSQEAGRTATGAIEKSAKTPAAAPGDRLKIAPGNSGSGSEAKADAAAEELLAKNKALKEAGERITLLEKNVTDLQRLLEMQKDLAAKTEAAVTPATANSELATKPEVPEAEPSPLGFEVTTDTLPLPANQVAPDLGAIDPSAVGLQTEAEAVQAKASVGSSKTWLLGGGAGLVLGLVALGLWFGVNKRRKKASIFTAETKATEVTALQEESVISDTLSSNQTVPITEAIADVAALTASAPVVPKAQEPAFQSPVEPQQTLEALVVESAHKLTEQDRLAQDNQQKSTPEPAVEELAVEELAEIEADALNTEIFEVHASNASAQDAIPDLQEEADYASRQEDSLASDVDLNFPEDAIETPGANAERSILDDLGDLERSAAAAQAELDSLRKAALPIGATVAQPAKEASEDLQALAGNPSDEPSDDAFEKAMADLNLDIPDEPLDEASWQEVATKLDLAGAYVEIGDSDGARELLDEIVRKGDSDQVRKAKALLGALV